MNPKSSTSIPSWIVVLILNLSLWIWQKLALAITHETHINWLISGLQIVISCGLVMLIFACVVILVAKFNHWIDG